MQQIQSLKIRSIVVAMALTLVASAAFQISSFRSARRMEAIGNQDAHVRDLLLALGALRSAVQDAEMGRGGYVLPGDAPGRQRYQDAIIRIPEMLGQIGALTADDPLQAEYARRLMPLTQAELLGLESARAALSQRVPAADATQAEAARPRADEIRRVIDGMAAQAQEVRAEYLNQTRAAASFQARSLVFASIYRVFVLAAGCTLILRQQARQRQTERICRRNEEFFRNAFDHAAIGMTLADDTGRWVKVNRAMCDLLGYTQEELLQTAPQSIAPPEDLARKAAALEQLRAGQSGRTQLEMRYLHKDGHTVWTLVTKSLIRDEQGRPQTFISQIQDVTERKQAEDRLRHLSLHDGLTGLPNRVLLDERLRRGIERANRDSDFHLAVLFLDLDRFKQINDSLGHAAGDQLLVTVAERLRRCVRGADSISRNASTTDATSDEGAGLGHTVARLAGDEFTVLLEGFRSPADAERVAERILRELAEPVEFGGQQIHPGASIGIVHATGQRYTAAPQLMADADAALYKAKAAGRGCYAVFDADAQQSAQDRLRLAGELRRAFEQEQFALHYQPIVSLLDGRVTGFEAAPHWNHPDRGLLAPDQFLDVAEETGLSAPLGAWALRHAFQQLAQWAHAPIHSSASARAEGGSVAQPPSAVFRRQAEMHSGLATGITAEGGCATFSHVPNSTEPFILIPLSRKQLLAPELLDQVPALQTEHPETLATGRLRITITEPALLQSPERVNAVLTHLRSAGIQVWLDHFGSGVTSLHCIRATPLDGLKIDARVIASASGRRDDAAVVHSVLELARNLRLETIADGLESPDQVVLLQAMGCAQAQGPHFGGALLLSEAQRMLAGRGAAITARSA